MIKSKDIIELLEKWVKAKVEWKSYEIMENPSTWREAVDHLKDVLLQVDKLRKNDQFLRFVYNPKGNELLVWVSYYAVFKDIMSDAELRSSWLGNISIVDKVVNLHSPQDSEYNRKRVDNKEELPEKLKDFLAGLHFHFGDVGND